MCVCFWLKQATSAYTLTRWRFWRYPNRRAHSLWRSLDCGVLLGEVALALAVHTEWPGAPAVCAAFLVALHALLLAVRWWYYQVLPYEYYHEEQRTRAAHEDEGAEHRPRAAAGGGIRCCCCQPGLLCSGADAALSSGSPPNEAELGEWKRQPIEEREGLIGAQAV